MADFYPTTAQQLLDDVERNASVGDTVHVPAGSFELTEILTIPAGVTVAGAGKGATAIVGQVNADMKGSEHGIEIRDLTIDIRTVATGVILISGVITLTDVHIQGPATATSNSLSIGASTHPVTALLTRVSSDNSSRDCIAFTAGSQELGMASQAALWYCSAKQPGPGTSDNCLTTHAGFPITDNYGVYDGGTNLNNTIAVDLDPESKITLNGTRARGHVDVWRATRCTVICDGIARPVLSLMCADAYVVGCRIVGDATNTCGIECYVANPRVESCDISGLEESSGILGASSSNGAFVCINNRVRGCKVGYNIGKGINLTSLVFRNNTEEDSTGTYSFVASDLGEGVLDAGYNTLETAVHANYGTAKTGDALNTRPQYTAGGFPLRGGNLYRNGDATVTLVGTRDINGRPRVPGGLICRGPAEAPRRGGGLGLGLGLGL